MADLSTTYMGIKLRNPVIAASSGLTNSLEDIMELEQYGAAAVVLKSLFEEEIRIELEKDLSRMTRESFLYPETIDYYDTYDVEDTLTTYLKLIRDCKQKVTIPVFASINCVTAEKWPYYAATLQDSGADGLELNVFILPSDTSQTAEEHEKLYFEIIEKVKEQVTIPIALKISYYSSNLASLIERLSKTGIAGLVLFNRFYSPDIDIDRFEVLATNVFSNPEEMSIPLRWIAIMADRVGCDLAASTGIHDGKAVIKQLLAGATATQVASVLYRKGKEYIKTMLNEIEGWMNNKDFKYISDFRGRMSLSGSENPAAYYRVQFMKHFAGKQ
ncbi:MAG: dihydroorotate dehydrogenase-like protein [Bacteroidales bacterium]|nr:MAG: dihydroorotate dehydrogenase-like protein [Bacteroidales bacterium]